MFDPLGEFVRLAMLMGDTIPNLAAINTSPDPNKWAPVTHPTGTRFIADGEDIDADSVNRVAAMLSAQTERVLLQLQSQRVAANLVGYNTAHLQSGGVGNSVLPYLTNRPVLIPHIQSLFPTFINLLSDDHAQVVAAEAPAYVGSELEVSDLTHWDGTPGYAAGVSLDHTIKTDGISEFYRWGVKVASAVDGQLVESAATGGSPTTLVDAVEDFVAAGVQAGWVIWNKTQRDKAVVTSVAAHTLTFSGGMLRGTTPVITDDYEVMGPNQVQVGVFATITGSATNDGTYLVDETNGRDVVLSLITTDTFTGAMPDWEYEEALAEPTVLEHTDVAGSINFRTLGKFAVNPTLSLDRPFPVVPITAGDITGAWLIGSELVPWTNASVYYEAEERRATPVGSIVPLIVKQLKGFTALTVSSPWGYDSSDWKFTPADSIESIHRRLNAASLDNMYRKGTERDYGFGLSYEQPTTGVAGEGRRIFVDGGAVELSTPSGGDLGDINRALLRLYSSPDGSSSQMQLDILNAGIADEYLDAAGTKYLPLTESVAALTNEIVAGSLSMVVIGDTAHIMYAASQFPLSMKTSAEEGIGSVVILLLGPEYQVGVVQSRDWALQNEIILVNFRTAPTTMVGFSMRILHPTRLNGTPPTNESGLTIIRSQQAHHIFSAPSYESATGVNPFDNVPIALVHGWSGYQSRRGEVLAKFTHSRIYNPVSPPVAPTTNLYQSAAVSWRGLEAGLPYDNLIFASAGEEFPDITAYGYQGVSAEDEILPLLMVRHRSEGLQSNVKPENHTAMLGLPLWFNAAGGQVHNPGWAQRHGRLLAWDGAPRRRRLFISDSGADHLGFTIGGGHPVLDNSAQYTEGPIFKMVRTDGGVGNLRVTNLDVKEREVLQLGEMARGVNLLTITESNDESAIGTYYVTNFVGSTGVVTLATVGLHPYTFDSGTTASGYLWSPTVLNDAFSLAGLSAGYSKAHEYYNVESPLVRYPIVDITAAGAGSITCAVTGEINNYERLMFHNPTDWVIYNATKGTIARVIGAPVPAAGVVTIPHETTIAHGLVDTVYAILYYFANDSLEVRRNGLQMVTKDVSRPGQLGAFKATLSGGVPISGDQVAGVDVGSMFYASAANKNIQDIVLPSASAPPVDTYYGVWDFDLIGQVYGHKHTLINGAMLGYLEHEPPTDAHGYGLKFVYYYIQDSHNALTWMEWYEDPATGNTIDLNHELTLNLNTGVKVNFLNALTTFRALSQILDTPLSNSVTGSWLAEVEMESAYNSITGNAVSQSVLRDNFPTLDGQYGFSLGFGVIDFNGIPERAGPRMWTLLGNSTELGFAMGSQHRYTLSYSGFDRWPSTFFGTLGLLDGAPKDHTALDDYLPRAYLAFHHAMVSNESDAPHVLGLGHPEYWDQAIGAASTLPKTWSIDTAAKPENTMHWAFTAGEAKQNLPGTYGDPDTDEDRRTASTHPVIIGSVQPTPRFPAQTDPGLTTVMFATPALLEVVWPLAGGSNTFYDNREYWTISNTGGVLGGSWGWFRLPYEAPIPGSMLTRITFEASVQHALVGATLGADIRFDIEREAMVDRSPGVADGTFTGSGTGGVMPGYTYLKRQKHRVLLYPTAAVPNPEGGVTAPVNQYDATQLTAWMRRIAGAAGIGEHVIDQLVMPTSRLCNSTDGPEYPVWFPRHEIQSVSTWTDGLVLPAVAYPGMVAVELHSNWTPAEVDTGVVTNPFVVYDSAGPPALLRSVRRTQISRGDFLYVWKNSASVGEQLLTFPIIGEADPRAPIGYANPVIVVWDKDGDLVALLADGPNSTFCTAPAFLNKCHLKMWNMARSVPAGGSFDAYWFHHSEFEAMPIAQSMILPAELAAHRNAWTQIAIP